MGFITSSRLGFSFSIFLAIVLISKTVSSRNVQPGESAKSTDLLERNLPPYMSAAFNGSFAHFTITKRLPIILQNVAKDFDRYHKCRSMYRNNTIMHAGCALILWSGSASYDLSTAVLANSSVRKEVDAESVQIAASLAELGYQMKNNEPILRFHHKINSTRTAPEDIDAWNWALESDMARNQLNSSDVPRWSHSPITFVECYFYRRLRHIFQQSEYFSDWEHFNRRKDESIQNNIDNIISMMDYLNDTLERIASTEAKFSPTIQLNLENILRLSVWGNKGDLSHTATHGKSDITNHDFHLEQQNMKDLLLVDHSDYVWKHLAEINKKNKTIRIDIICDNYGFELTTDLVLGEFLIVSQLASQVRYHVKAMPWFVSDVTVPDFPRKLDLVNEHVGRFGDKWSKYLAEGKFVVTTDPYWTLPFDYDWMNRKAPKLYEELSKSDLIIFKGDLNYRKLTGELAWPPATPFWTALRSFHPAPLCSLRGLKSEVIVGLASGKAEEMTLSDKQWMVSGKYAVIQCFAPQ